MTKDYAVAASHYVKTPLFIIGADGNVGSAIMPTFEQGGWDVFNLAAGAPLPAEPGAVLIDAGPAGTTGYLPATWDNYLGAVERAISLIAQAERAGYAAVVLFSTPWVALRSGDAYADSKALIEDIARAHNHHGKCFVLVDRVGMQNDAAASPSRFELSVRQAPGELGERVLASLLHAVPSLGDGGTLKPLPPVQPPKPFVDDAR